MTDTFDATGGEATQTAYTPHVSSDPSLERERRGLEGLQTSQGLALRETFEDAGLTDRLFSFIGASDRESFNKGQRRVFGDMAEQELTPDEANAQFGVEGRLRFDAPVDRNIAAWRQSQAQRSEFRDQVVANADLSWWQQMGAGFLGSVLDPVSLPLWLVPELAAGRVLQTGMAGTRLARLGRIGGGAVRGTAEGVAGGVLYEGANLWLHHEAADDYSLGQASANILLGGLFGSVTGAAGGWWTSRGRAPRAPALIEQLNEPQRMGALVEAMEAMVEDRPVDLGPVMMREARARAEGRPPVLDATSRHLLDETEGQGAEATINARFVRYDTAVTPRGDDVDVGFALVEVEDLITSHDDDLFPDGRFPRDLQPRQRDRAGAQARNRALETDLNPKRLMFDAGAETGAPIVSRQGLVESGNGRTIALRRSYRNGTPAAARYRAELEAQGLDVSGMKAPVLTRIRRGALTAEDRIRLTRDMNAETTEAYSPSERALADAEAVDDDLLGMVDGADMSSAGNRRFVKGFLDRIASDDLNRMTTAGGALSDAGLDRINAALVARAYGDRGLVEALFEATDNNIKAIGKALATAAPEWAGMRAAIGRGEVPEALDPTENLKAAVAFVKNVRQRGGSVAEAMDLTVGQYDAFAGAAMTPETEAFVRAFFRTSPEGVTLWKSPRSATSLAEGLRWLASEVRKAEPGPDLFGAVADESTSRQLLDVFGQWFRREGNDGSDLFDFGPDATAIPAGGDVRPSVLDGGREPRRQADGETLEKPRVAKGEPPPPPKGDPYADPEIAALAADTDAWMAREGLSPDAVGGDNPQTVADAVAAGAFCLKGGGA